MSRATTATASSKKAPSSSSTNTAAANRRQSKAAQQTAAAAAFIDEDNDDDHDDAQDHLFERAADQLFASEYLLVLIGPSFDDGGVARNPFSFEQSHYRMAQYPSKFFGFWGNYYNDAQERQPHSGYHILSRWRDSAFAQGTGPGGSKVNKPTGPPPDDDDRKGKGGEGGKSNYQLLQQRMMCMTSLVSNMPIKAGIPQDEVYEVSGNVTQWQCGQNNRCGPPFTFLLDRGVTFDVDECTQEALPLKYVAPSSEDGEYGGNTNSTTAGDPASIKNRPQQAQAGQQQQDPFSVADRLVMSDNDADEEDYDRLVRGAKLYEKNPDYYASDASHQGGKSSAVAAAAAGRSAMSQSSEAVFHPMQANSAFNSFESRLGREERVRRDIRRENRGRVIRVKKDWQFGAKESFPQDPFKGFVEEIPLPIKSMPVPQSHQFEGDEDVRTQARAEYEASQLANVVVVPPSNTNNNNNNQQQQEVEDATANNNEEGADNNSKQDQNSNIDEEVDENKKDSNNDNGAADSEEDKSNQQPKPFNPLLSRPTSSTKPISIHKVVGHSEKLVSHLYCHSQVIDRQIHAERVGNFHLVDAKRYAIEREALYAAFSGQKSYTLENSNAFARRANTIRYNISMCFLTNEDETNVSPSSVGQAHHDENDFSGLMMNNNNNANTTSPRHHNYSNKNNTTSSSFSSALPSIVFRPSAEEQRLLGDFHHKVLPADVAEALFKPNSSSSSPTNNLNNNNNNNNLSSSMTSPQEARQYASEFLRDKSKIQGKNGWYFFSHIAPARTCQEPLRGLLYDQIRVSDFPEYRKQDFVENNSDNNNNYDASSGKNSFSSTQRMTSSSAALGTSANSAASGNATTVPLVRRIPPQGGKVSIVVDMLQIFNLGAGPNVIPTYEYSSRTFQVVGYLPPPLVAGQEFTSNLLSGGGADGTSGSKSGGRSNVYTGGSSGTTSSAAAAHLAAGARHLEYLLETVGNCPFVVKIGVLASAPSIIQYVEFDIPCGRAESQHIAAVTGRSSSSSPDNNKAASSSSRMMQHSQQQSFSARAAQTLGGAAALLKPVPNHIFCPHCKGLARPFVSMVPFTSPTGTKDPLFCSTAQNPKSRLFAGWMKLILDSLKQDMTKSLCILELGAEKKNDATKSLGERTYKTMATTAGGRLRYVRLSQTKIDDSKLVKKKSGSSSSAASPPPTGGKRGNKNSASADEDADPFVAIQCNPSMGLSRLDSLLYDRMRKR